MPEYTQEEVLAAFERGATPLDDGQVACPLCDRVLRTIGALGPHYSAHRREVGLIPPRAKKAGRRLPAKVSPSNGQVSDLTAIEAVTGILSAACPDGLMPVRMLPSVANLTGHVDAVLAELRKRRPS